MKEKRKVSRPKKEEKKNDAPDSKPVVSVSVAAPKHRALFFSSNNMFRG